MKQVGEQLQMFMDPRDIQRKVGTSPDVRPGETMDDMWERKVDEAERPRDFGHGSGVMDALRTNGYDGAPVEVYHNPPREKLTNDGYVETRDYHMGNGHHRVAAAASLGMQFVPVLHSSWQEGESRPMSTPRVSDWHDVRLPSVRHAERKLDPSMQKRNWESEGKYAP